MPVMLGQVEPMAHHTHTDTETDVCHLLQVHSYNVDDINI